MHEKSESEIEDAQILKQSFYSLYFSHENLKPYKNLPEDSVDSLNNSESELDILEKGIVTAQLNLNWSWSLT